MRRIVMLIGLAWLVLGVALPSEAIIGGQLDGRRHPFGACILSRLPDGTFTDCSSGALASPNVVIMAGHSAANRNAIEGAEHFVTFDPEVVPSVSTLIPAVLVPHPGFNPNNSFNDLGVALLAVPVTEIEPIQLPTENLLDDLFRDGRLAFQLFTVVGTGAGVRTTSARSSRASHVGSPRFDS